MLQLKLAELEDLAGLIDEQSRPWQREPSTESPRCSLLLLGSKSSRRNSGRCWRPRALPPRKNQEGSPTRLNRGGPTRGRVRGKPLPDPGPAHYNPTPASHGDQLPGESRVACQGSTRPVRSSLLV